MTRYIQVVSFIWLATFITFSFASAGDIEHDWNIFKMKYSKKYENRTEDLIRMDIFKENKNKITEHNQNYEKGFVSYKMALNKFADWTMDELVKTSGQIVKATTTAELLTANSLLECYLQSTAISLYEYYLLPSFDRGCGTVGLNSTRIW